AGRGGRSPLRGSRRPLEQRRLPLADADAERREPVAAAAAPELVDERDDEARAAHPERVPDRDRAAVDVHLLRIESELTDDDQALRRERLVQLDEVYLARVDSDSGQQLPHCRNGTD